MSVFADSGRARGVLNWNARQNKRRSEIAGLFEQFKKNNPYATAEDYNQYIETIVGPHEMYLRGNLPAGQMLQRMEQDNLQRKSQADRRENVEIATKDLAMKNQLQDMAGRMMLSHNNDEIIDALAGAVAQPGDPNYLEQKEMIRGLVGDLDQQRDLKFDDLYRTTLNESLGLIERTGGDVSMDDIMSGFRSKFPNQNLRGVKGYEDRLQKETKFAFDKAKEDQNIKRQTRRSDLMFKIMNSEMLARKMTAGTEQRADAEAMIDQLMIQHGFNPKTDTDIREDIMRDLTGTQTMILDAERKSLVANGIQSQTAGLKAQHDQQGQILSARDKGMPKSRQGILEELHVQYLLSPPLMQNLTDFIVNERFDERETAAQEWIGQLTPVQQEQLIPVSQFPEMARQNAERLAPVHQTAEEFVRTSQKRLSDYEQEGQRIIKDITDIFSEARSVRSLPDMQRVLESIEAARSIMGSDIKELNEELDYAIANPDKWVKGNRAFTDQDASTMLRPQLQQNARVIGSQLDDLEQQVQYAIQQIGQSQASSQMSDDPAQEGIQRRSKAQFGTNASDLRNRAEQREQTITDREAYMRNLNQRAQAGDRQAIMELSNMIKQQRGM